MLEGLRSSKSKPDGKRGAGAACEFSSPGHLKKSIEISILLYIMYSDKSKYSKTMKRRVCCLEQTESRVAESRLGKVAEDGLGVDRMKE